MNEVVVDRGPSPYLTNLEIFCNGRIMTSVQGDGMCDLHNILYLRKSGFSLEIYFQMMHNTMVRARCRVKVALLHMRCFAHA